MRIWLVLALVMHTAMAPAEPLRIIAFGDSLMAGFGLPLEHGFPAQMQSWLKARGHEVVVVNASVSGDTTAGGLARIAWTLGEPADAVMVELGANDMLRAIDPAVTRANMTGILKEIADRGLPVLVAGMQAPGNYGETYMADYNAIFPELAEQYGAVLYPQFLQGLAAAGDTIADIGAVMQSDGLHPNADGVRLIVEDMGPVVASWIEGF